MTDEQKQDLSHCPSELSKATSTGGKLVGIAQVALGKMNAKEGGLNSMSLNKLQSTLEEAEEVI